MKAISPIYPLLLLLFLLSGCNEGEEQPESSRVAVEPIPVKTAVLEPEFLHETITLYGVLKPSLSIALSSDFSAKVAEAYVEEGERVSVGQALLRFDMSKIRLRHDELKYRLQQAQVLEENARQNLRRISALQSENSVSRQLLENTRSELDSATASTMALQSQLSLIQHDLKNEVLTSPAEGIVKKRFVDPAEFIQAANPLYELETDTSLKVSVFVGERVVGLLSVGDDSVVQTSTGKSRAKVFSISSNADPDTGNYEVQLLLDNQLRKHRPGMSADVSLTALAKTKSLVIPDTAIVTDKGEYVVFTVVDSVAKRQSIQLGVALNERYKVLSGVRSGDVIVTQGADRLISGSNVITGGQGE